MARPLRINLAGGWYHVRGLGSRRPAGRGDPAFGLAPGGGGPGGTPDQLRRGSAGHPAILAESSRRLENGALRQSISVQTVKAIDLTPLPSLRTIASILMSGGQGRLKPSPGIFLVASMPSMLPLGDFARHVVQHVGRLHFFTSGLRILSCGKAEKSRSADQSSLTPWWRQSAAMRASWMRGPFNCAAVAILRSFSK